MFLTDLPFILFWWSILFFLGALFFPLTAKLFPYFLDRGYIFAKILGILVLSYLVWLLGIVKILPFSQNGIFLILSLSLFFSILSFLRNLSYLSNIKKLPINWKIFLFEELLFFLTFSFWSLVKAHQPDIIGLEKYMDFGFINSLLRSQYFPPLDMWLAQSSDYSGHFINYYYFGHLATSVLTKLSGLDPALTFNLMLATIFGLTFTGSFSIALNLIKQIGQIRPIRLIFFSLLTAFLVTLAGNLHTLYAFFKSYIPFDKPVPFWQLPWQLNFSSYWYPNATRFIPFTIHEFPSYSFVVSDLHGHVLDIPFVLLTIALLLSFVIGKASECVILSEAKDLARSASLRNVPTFVGTRFLAPIKSWLGMTKGNKCGILFLLILGLSLAVMYMTNAWDGLIYFGLSVLVLLSSFLLSSRAPLSGARDLSQQTLLKRSLHSSRYAGLGRDDIIGCLILTIKYLILLFLLLVAFSLPFHLTFKPFVFGIGIVKDHSPLWMLAVLWGFFYFCVAGFIFFVLIPSLRKRWEVRNGKLDKEMGDFFIILLILLSTLLLIFPEFFFVKDIYPAHYRANTMFKMGYQAFIMLSLASGYIIARIFANKTNKTNLTYKTYQLFLLLLFFLVSLYPYFSLNSYFNGLKNYQGLYGLSYLAKNNPDDYQTILWLNKNVSGQPTVLEAVGDSYTEYARISSNTGLPTVLGWPVHEWLWRGSYDEAGKRVEEVKNFYSTPDVEQARKFIKKYKVKYVIVGKLEEQKYPSLFEEKLKGLGEIVFAWGTTKIYKINFEAKDNDTF